MTFYDPISVVRGKTIVFALLIFCAANSGASEGPDVLVRNTTEQVLKVLRSDPDAASSNQDHIAEIVSRDLLKHFNFEKMTQLALGRNWRNVGEAERTALVDEFRALLVRTYSSALSAYRNEEIITKPLSLEPGVKIAVVQTSVSQPGDKPISINYRMEQYEAGWKVYDVIVEGVSLVINYRSLFNSTIESSGVDGLIKLLREKNVAV